MLRYAADENFNNDIIRGVLRRDASIDIKRVQDAGLFGADDPTVLKWAAQENRILITHDRATVPMFAVERMQSGKPMSGVFIVPVDASIRRVIEDLLLMARYSEMEEWNHRVIYLPL